MIGIRGNSFSNGAGNPNGPLGLGQAKRDAGWQIKPVTHWDFTEGREPELLP
jgi:hypothetical protein